MQYTNQLTSRHSNTEAYATGMAGYQDVLAYALRMTA